MFVKFTGKFELCGTKSIYAKNVYIKCLYINQDKETITNFGQIWRIFSGAFLQLEYHFSKLHAMIKTEHNIL